MRRKHHVAWAENDLASAQTYDGKRRAVNCTGVNLGKRGASVSGGPKGAKLYVASVRTRSRLAGRGV